MGIAVVEEECNLMSVGGVGECLFKSKASCKGVQVVFVLCAKLRTTMIIVAFVHVEFRERGL